MKSKIAAGLLAVVVAASGAAWAFWSIGNGKALRLPGIVEIQEVRLASKVGGRVEVVHVKEGEVVEKHRELIVFEAPELRNQKKQLQARLAQAEADWEKAKNGPRWEEIGAAFASFNSTLARYHRVKVGWREEEKQQAIGDRDAAEADFKLAEKEWKRVKKLWDDKVTSQLEYDAAVAAKIRTEGRLKSAQARHEMIVKQGSRQEDIDEAYADMNRSYANFALLANGTRKEDKDLAKAKVDELRAGIEAIDINLAETKIIVPPNLGKAVVEVVAVRPGDLVPPNQPVVRVLRIQDLWVKVYVPETQYGFLTLDKKVTLTIDTHPGKIFHGVIVQRSNISEFTPRNVQSADERRNQVFGVKIRVDDPQGVLNAGMAAEVTIPLE